LKITAANALVKCLELENVKTVFGYPGAAICPFYDELCGSGIEHILVRQEQNAGHAASGYARITGSPAVCATTSGPGALNIITAIATAYMDSIPIIIITGQVSTELIGRDVFQEADITGASEPFVKHSFLIKNAAELPEIVKKAFYIAGTGRPGPVLLDIPVDILRTEIDFEYPESIDIRGYKPSFAGNKLQIKRAAEAVDASEKPLICAGGGLFNRQAHILARKFAEKADIPVISTMMGIGALPTNHPLYYGMIGMHGRKEANDALNSCDLLILLGARVNDRAVLALENADKMRIIHIDIDPAEIGKNLPVAIPIVGDAGAVLEQIIEIITPNVHDDWNNELRKSKVDDKSYKPVKVDNNKNHVNPKEFIQVLNRLIPDNTVISADVGQNQIWTASNIEIGEKGRFITSGGMGTMGYSIPAAIGAKKAAPDREVIAICGDGSFQMQMMELATAVQHNIGVKIIVMANNRLGMVRELQKNIYGGRITAVNLDGSPDFVKLAEAYGISADYVNDISAAQKALITLLASKKPYLLQVSVDKDERSVL